MANNDTFEEQIADNAYSANSCLLRRIGYANSTSKKDRNELFDTLVDEKLSSLKGSNEDNPTFFIFPPLEEMSDDDKKQKILLTRGNNNDNKPIVGTGNMMGFLGRGDYRLTIYSRFSESADKDYFFNYILAKVFDIPNLVDLKIDLSSEKGILDLAAFLFPSFLKKAVNKGLYKSYIRKEYNDSNVKGVIDVKRHIKQNIPFLGKIAYSTREFSFDNPVTQLVRHTIEFIKNKYGATGLLANDPCTKQAVAKIVEVTPSYRPQDRQKIIIENERRPVKGGYYIEYRTLQRWCLMILKSERVAFGKSDNQVYGILFDGAWLWEEYVHSLISDKFEHTDNKKKIGTRYLFTKNGDDDEGEIYPDFIGHSNEKCVIADAKYKREHMVGDKNKDYFQMLSYMYRFEAKTGLLIHPKDEGAEDVVLQLNRGIGEKADGVQPGVRIIKQGFAIPKDTSDYAKFEKAMKAQEKVFKDKLFASF